MSAAESDFVVDNVFSVLHRRSKPGWTIRDVVNWPSCCTLVWVNAGKATYVCEERELHVKAGQMLLFPSGTRRSGTTDPTDPWVFDTVAFRLTRADGTPALLRGLPLSAEPRGVIDLSASMHELNLHWHAQTVASQLRCRGIVMRLLAIFLQAAAHVANTKARPPALDDVIDLLSRSPNRWFTSDELAARVKLSPSRFRVVFQRATGMSVVRYQNSIRVRRACALLRSGEHTVTETADMLGFSDVYYFSRVFKKLTGFTPSSQIIRAGTG